MTKLKRIALIATLLLAGFMTITTRGTAVFAQDQTVPTRTPTPGASVPTSPTPTKQSGGGDPAPNPTQTGEPPAGATATSPANGATATSPSGGTGQTTAASTPVATKIGAQVGTNPEAGVAGQCDAPTITVIDLTLVHTGPGSDYPVVGSLPANESRYIVGRAGFAPWWQILLIESEPQLLGWVADGNHLFSGDIASVPVVEPPFLNGVAPTPGALWLPTPPPTVCSPTATPTTTPTATPTTELTAAITAAGPSGISSSGAEAIVVESGSAAELNSQGSSIGKQLQDTNNNSAASEANGASETSETSQSSSGSGAAPLMVPLLGAALIAGGIIIGLLSRARPPAA